MALAENVVTVVCVLVGGAAVVTTGYLVSEAMSSGYRATPSELELRERVAKSKLEAVERKLAAYNKSRDNYLEEWEKSHPVPELA